MSWLNRMIFSLNDLKIFKDLINYKLKNQKQFNDITEIENLNRLIKVINNNIKDFTRQIKEYDF